MIDYIKNILLPKNTKFKYIKIKLLINELYKFTVCFKIRLDNSFLDYDSPLSRLTNRVNSIYKVYIGAATALTAISFMELCSSVPS